VADPRDAELFGEPVLPPSTDPRDAELCGEPTPTSPPDASAPAPDPTPFGEALISDSLIGSRLSEADDPLAIGGRARMRLQYTLDDDDEPLDASLSAPNLLDLYLDGRPNDRVRAYARWRLRYDFTVTDGEPDAFGRPAEALTTSLDQLWLKFDVDRLVYVTLGRQPVRWGSGRFWNPTDFLNAQRRDPLAIFDERLGVGVLKLHVPLEGAGGNLYAVANFEGASTPEDVGGAARAEVLVANTEVAVSAAARKDDPIRLGLDLSSALSDFDVRVEGAVTHGDDRPYYEGAVDVARLVFPDEVDRSDDWIPQVTAGAEISILYSDQDSVIVGGEYFFNDGGVSDPALYVEGPVARRVADYILSAPQVDQAELSRIAAEVVGERFVPFYLGRHYASGYLALMQPGDWNDTTIVASAIGNLSDDTWLARLDYSVRVLTYLDVNAYAAVHLGEPGGELRFELVDPTTQEVAMPASRLDLGVWLSLAI